MQRNIYITKGKLLRLVLYASQGPSSIFKFHYRCIAISKSCCQMVPHGVIVFGGTARFPVTTDQVLAFDQARSLSFVCKFTLLDRIGTHGCSWINVRPLKRCHVSIRMEFWKRFTWRDLHVLGHESRSRTDFACREQLIISLSLIALVLPYFKMCQQDWWCQLRHVIVSPCSVIAVDETSR